MVVQPWLAVRGPRNDAMTCHGLQSGSVLRPWSIRKPTETSTTEKQKDLNVTDVIVVERMLEDHESCALRNVGRSVPGLALVLGNVNVAFDGVMVYRCLRECVSIHRLKKIMSCLPVGHRKRRDEQGGCGSGIRRVLGPKWQGEGRGVTRTRWRCDDTVP